MSRKYKKTDWTEEWWGVGVGVVMLLLMFACYSISAEVKTITRPWRGSFDSLKFHVRPEAGGDSVPVNLAQDENLLESDTSGLFTIYLSDSANYKGYLDVYYGGQAYTSEGRYEIKSSNGPDTLWYYATDTCNSERVQGVRVGLYTYGGVFMEEIVTNASGYALLTMTQLDTFVIISYGPSQYSWNIDTIFGFTPGTIDSTNGCKVADPAAAASTGAVTVYIDLGTGLLNPTTGLMTPHENLIGKLILQGGNFFTAGSWGIIPTLYVDTADANGRLTWKITSNDVISPSGSFYDLYFETRSGQPISYGEVLRFTVDTLTDPLNIISATEVR